MASTLPHTVALGEPSATPLAVPPARLMSLDLFRGGTIALMILVNDAGDGQVSYWPLEHSRWNGWTPTDLVFPFFLFIVGVAMAFSFSSRRVRGESRSQLMMHVLWRGLILFALGMFVNGFPNHYHLATWRIYGVLQRIAICYVITAALALWTGRRAQVSTAIACLVGYWVLMRYVSVPGFGTPTHDIPLLDPDRNLVAWLDRKLLFGHLYEVTRDPEGLLSTIPAVATSLLGLLTGGWLRADRRATVKAAWMAAFGVLGFAAGEFFNIWFPINKKLWTSSFVVLTAGLALLVLALCYWVLDIKQWRGRWSNPLEVFGKNAIAAYILSEVVAAGLDSVHVHASGGLITWHDAIYEYVFVPLGSPANASLLYALTYVLFCWIVMWILYRQRIFVKI